MTDNIAAAVAAWQSEEQCHHFNYEDYILVAAFGIDERETKGARAEVGRPVSSLVMV